MGDNPPAHPRQPDQQEDKLNGPWIKQTDNATAPEHLAERLEHHRSAPHQGTQLTATEKIGSGEARMNPPLHPRTESQGCK